MTRSTRSTCPVSATRATRTAVLLLACGLATACSESPGAPPPAQDVSAATESAEPVEPAEPAEPQVETYAVGVMEQFLSDLSAVGSESSAELVARLQAEEETTAACIREQGFEYTPLDWSSVTIPDVRHAPNPQREITEEDLEFAAEYGYGILVQPPGDGPVPGAGPSTPEDPNAAYVEAMSPAEEEAYYLALWGPGQGEAYIVGDEPYDWTKYGCVGLAGHESGTDTRVVFDETPYEALRAEIEAMWPTIDQDPRIVAANQEWAACMESAGFPEFDLVVGTPMSFVEENSRIVDATHGAQAYDLSTNDYLTSPEYLAAEQAAGQMRAEAARREAEVAVADLGCQDEVDFPRVYAETSADVQQQFYDAHRVDLEAWLAAAQEYGSGL